MWRIVTAERLSVTLSEIQNEWDMLDVLHANQVLDAFEDAEWKHGLKYRNKHGTT